MNYVNFLNASLYHDSFIADPWSYTPTTKHVIGVNGYLEVSSSDFNKTVELYYTYDGINWKTKYADYLQTTPYGKEIWSFHLEYEEISEDIIKKNFRSALRLNSFGTDYWSNNHGENYNLYSQNHFQGDQPYFKFLQVKTYRSTKDQHVINEHCVPNVYLNVEVEVEGQDHQKEIEMYYSTNLGSWQTYYGSYSKTLDNGNELWIFDILIYNPSRESIDLEKLKKSFKGAFKLRYFKSIFWHNNYSQNYSI